MKRAAVTIPDDLEKAVDSYVRAQEAPPPRQALGPSGVDLRPSFRHDARAGMALTQAVDTDATFLYCITSLCSTTSTVSEIIQQTY